MTSDYYQTMEKYQKGLYQAIVSGMPANDIEIITLECYKLSRRHLNQIIMRKVNNDHN